MQAVNVGDPVVLCARRHRNGESFDIAFCQPSSAELISRRVEFPGYEYVTGFYRFSSYAAMGEVLASYLPLQLAVHTCRVPTYNAFYPLAAHLSDKR